jgi:hypothetical protein
MFGYTMKTTYIYESDNFHPIFFPSLLTIENLQSHFFQVFIFYFSFWQYIANFKKRLIPPYLWSPINTISCHFPTMKKTHVVPNTLCLFYFLNVNYKYKTLVSSMLPKSGWKWKLIIYYFIFLIIHPEQLRQ